MVEKIAMAGALILLVGCAQPPVKYLPDEKQLRTTGPALDVPAEQKSTVEFTTNTFEPTKFEYLDGGKKCSFNGDRAIGTLQRARDMDGNEKFLLNASAVVSLGLTTLFDPRNQKTPHTVVNEVAAGEAVTVQVGSSLFNGNTSKSCGPLYLRFTPEGGARYQVNFIGGGATCNVDLKDITTVSEPKRVKHARWLCTKSFFGAGGNEAIAYQELN